MKMTLRKILGWAVVIFIAYYVFTSPVAAGGAAKDLFGLVGKAGSSLATFLTSL
jgi:hypothetical protein